jgi:hypothetical protein
MTEETNDSWSSLKKTIIGTVGTLATAGGAFLMTYLQKPKEGDVKQAAPQSININMPAQQAASSKTVIYKESAPAQKDLKKADNSEKPAKKKEFTEDPKW